MTQPGNRRPALGRGMAALLQNAAPPAPTGRSILSLPIEAVQRSAVQPRKRFDDRKLEELAGSIRDHGVLEPILVRRAGTGYAIVAGERRWRAAQRAGLKEIPAILREATDQEAFELALCGDDKPMFDAAPAGTRISTTPEFLMSLTDEGVHTIAVLINALEIASERLG